MRDKKLYSQILGIETPWFVSDVELSLQAQQVKVFIEPLLSHKLLHELRIKDYPALIC